MIDLNINLWTKQQQRESGRGCKTEAHRACMYSDLRSCYLQLQKINENICEHLRDRPVGADGYCAAVAHEVTEQCHDGYKT